jgi:hypothetical protein
MSNFEADFSGKTEAQQPEEWLWYEVQLLADGRLLHCEECTEATQSGEESFLWDGDRLTAWLHAPDEAVARERAARLLAETRLEDAAWLRIILQGATVLMVTAAVGWWTGAWGYAGLLAGGWLALTGAIWWWKGGAR